MRTTIATLLLAAAIPAMAQDSSRISHLSGVTVTATKGPQKASETGKVVTILSREYLDRNSGKSVAAILNEQAGLIVNGANNTAGTVPDVYMRGASSGNTLIMIDGQPVSDATSIPNSFDLNFIPAELVERIEILRGSQSTLYGSNAVAGVINVITRKGSGKKMGATAGLGYGSYNDKQAHASIHGQVNKLSYLAGYRYEKTDGMSDAYDPTGKANFDKDGFRQHAVFAKLGLDVGKRWNLQYLFNFNDYHHALDEYSFTDDKDYNGKSRYQLHGFHSTYTFGKGSWHMLYSFQQTNRNILNDSGYITPFGYAKYDNTSFRSNIHQAETFVNVDLSQQVRLVGGAAFTRSTMMQLDFLVLNTDTITPPNITDIPADSANSNQISAYASILLHNLGGFNLDAGGRYNYHSLYGNNATFSINPSYLINERHKLFLNVSSGYKVPSLYQLYFPGYGNSGLKPEVTTSYEAGYQLGLKRVNVRATGFYRHTKDLVIFWFDPVTYMSQYRNADKQEAYGGELEADVEITKGLNLTVNYSYTDGQISTAQNGKDTSYYNLYRIPRNAVNATLGYQVTPAFYAAATYRYVGERWESGNRMGDYYTLDLYGEYKFGNLLKIFGQFRNITDIKYFDITGYNSRRFNFNTGIILNL
ncbi:TonB-dependent siderophore receptor [Chitinophaga sp. sic0106]|uniref:TonB-dependent receptor plug domain-containing protein n=1 Tax=Chitinophaga sp. sic0106 TaxID=2854785 RepID=UPI001C44788C|nr:TonB-dependent receptor [Chitinophaga sp. sic0106]MBV7533462.1 TonB-dependent receptor [Chitinophaga sp. sic0106]